ncbi:unnamed protein product [Rotaria sp. Silwood1]|nr:unnamed protein product [Rotaria sp. Silwood1]CAF1667478.1 unnamed protein product [Rotaria sp. Silwood1]
MNEEIPVDDVETAKLISTKSFSPSSITEDLVGILVLGSTSTHILPNVDSNDVAVFILDKKYREYDYLCDKYPSLVDVYTEMKELIENLREYVYLDNVYYLPRNDCFLHYLCGVFVPCTIICCLSKRCRQWFWYKQPSSRRLL